MAVLNAAPTATDFQTVGKFFKDFDPSPTVTDWREVDAAETGDVKVVADRNGRTALETKQTGNSQEAQDDKIATKAAIDLTTPYADDTAAKAGLTEDGIVNVGGVTKLYDAESDTLSELAATVEDVDQFYQSKQAILDARTAVTDKTPFEDQTASFGVLADDGSYKVYRWDTVSDFAEIATSVPTAEYLSGAELQAGTDVVKFANAVELKAEMDRRDLLQQNKADQVQVVRDLATATHDNSVTEKAVRDLVELINVNGELVGTAPSIATLPAVPSDASTDIKYHAWVNTDVTDPQGLYVPNGTFDAWVLAAGINIAALTNAEMIQIAGDLEYDSAKQGLVSVSGLDAYFNSRLPLQTDVEADTGAEFTDPHRRSWEQIDQRIFYNGKPVDLRGSVGETLTAMKWHNVNNTTTLDLTVGNEFDRAALWNVQTQQLTYYQHDGTSYQPEAEDHEHTVLENIAVYVYSAGTDAGSAVQITFFDKDGVAYSPNDWTLSSGPGGLLSRTGHTRAAFSDVPYTGDYGIAHNKNDWLFFTFTGDTANGLSSVTWTATNGAQDDGQIIVNFVGTNYHVDFENKEAVELTEFTKEIPAVAADGLRGAPVAGLTELAALTAREGERRFVKVTKSDYHFKLTADLNATENGSASSVADGAATGKWVRQSFAALVDGYTYSGIDVANSSFGSGAISFKSSSFNTIYDPKGLVDVGNSFTITIDSPEKAGAYMMALNVTSGTVSGRVNARVNGNTVLIASGEDGTDSDAAMGVVELVEGDVVTLAITGSGTTYGVSFTMSQTRRFVDETQYVDATQVIPVEDERVLLMDASGTTLNGDGIGFLNGATRASIIAEYETVEFWVGDLKQGGNNQRNDWPIAAFPVEALNPNAAGDGIVRIHEGLQDIWIAESGLGTTGLTFSASNNDGVYVLKMWGIKKRQTVNTIDEATTQVDTTEVGTPLQAGSDRHYVMQWDGTKLVNTLAKEVWTEGTIGNSGYRKYMIDHLLGHARIAGRNVITSTGTISWNLDFALASAYVFAHDLREAQAETASMRINSRTVNSLQYTLHDSVGTGDAGSNVQFELSGDL